MNDHPWSNLEVARLGHVRGASLLSRLDDALSSATLPEDRLKVSSGPTIKVRIVDLRANPLNIAARHLAIRHRLVANVGYLWEHDVSLCDLAKFVVSVESHDTCRLVLLTHHLDSFLSTFQIKLIILLF